MDVLFWSDRTGRGRGVGAGFLLGSLLRELRPFVVTTHGVGVDDELEGWICREVLANQPVERLGDAGVGFRVIEQHLDWGQPIDDLFVVIGQRRQLPALLPSWELQRWAQRSDGG